MVKKIALRASVLFLLVGLQFASAQNESTKMLPLAEVLEIIEKRYNVSFSYAPSIVEGLTAQIPDDNLTLEDVLFSLTQTSQLEFQILDKRFIAINKRTVFDNFLMQNLDEVVLNNYLTTGISKNNLGSFNLKPEQFGILPGLIEPDVLLIAQALPGINSTDETVSNLNVRGGTNDQNLLLFDGMKMYQSGHFFGLISAFNPYLTKNVNIIKNGSSATYGDGVSSILSMETAKEISTEKKIGVGVNLLYADVFAEIPLNNHIEFQIAARRSVTDLITTPTFDNYFDRVFQDSDLSRTNDAMQTLVQDENFYFYDVNAKLLIKPSSKDMVNISFVNFFNKVDYNETATVNNTNEALNSQLNQQTVAGSLTFNRKWSEKIDTEVQLYITEYTLDATNFDIPNNQRLIQENEVLDGAIKLNLHYKPFKNLSLNTGYQFYEVGISNLEDVNNPIFRSLIKEVIRTHATYTEATFKSNNGHSVLRAGGRLNILQKFNTYLVEPRLSFSQRFANYFKFELLGEFKSQTTTQIIDLQNDFLGVEKRRWILSNNSTVPIVKSKQASAGITFKKNKLFVSAEGFYKEVEGITARSQAFQNQFQFVTDIGGYTIKGAELLLNYQFSNFSSWLSYTYNDNEYTFDVLNNGNPFKNNFAIEHYVNFGLNYTYKNLKIASGINWHSGLPITNPIVGNELNGTTINFEAPNSSTTSDYLRIDASVNYDLWLSSKTKLQVGASVWNVSNQRNVINTYYTLDNANQLVKVENLSLGITPNVMARVQF